MDTRDNENYNLFIEKLDALWENYKYVLFYGAGAYGKCLQKYCLDNKKMIQAFLVSDSQNLETKLLDGVPIMHLKDARFKKNESCIVLTLSDKYHNGIIDNLKKLGFNQVYSFSNNFFEALSTQKNLSLKMVDYAIKDQDIDTYQIKADKIINKYTSIRFCEFVTSRIGPMLELYIQVTDSKYSDKNVLNVFIPIALNREGNKEYFPNKSIANKYCLEKMQTKLEILTDKNIGFWKYVMENYRGRISFSRRYDLHGLLMNQRIASRDYQINNEKRHMFFTEEEEDCGRKKLQKMNLNKEYVCFIARSSKYFDLVVGNAQESQCIQRNCSVENFRLMCDNLFQSNIQSVRMGYLVDGKIHGAGIIDYASFYREEFMDFYLVAKCKFVVCQLSGFHFIATVFNKPAVIVNVHVLTIQGDIIDRCNPKQDLMIMKKIWCKKEKRFLTFQEILAFEGKVKNIFRLTEFYEEAGYELIENTSEEIWDVTEEMMKRLNGTICYTEEEILIQKKFKRMLKESVMASDNLYWNVPMGTMFLKKNQWLLG